MLGKIIRGLSSLIVILCALNVGLIGITHNKLNIIAKLCGGVSTPATQITYIIIGIAGVICLLSFCPFCSKKSRHSHGDSCSSGGCHSHHSDKNY
ncbi:Uncharacterized protein BN1224_CV14_A_00010, partial [Chlamydia pneumoniae]